MYTSVFTSDMFTIERKKKVFEIELPKSNGAVRAVMPHSILRSYLRYVKRIYKNLNHDIFLNR